jgi:hypothetical protein
MLRLCVKLLHSFYHQFVININFNGVYKLGIIKSQQYKWAYLEFLIND